MKTLSPLVIAVTALWVPFALGCSESNSTDAGTNDAGTTTDAGGSDGGLPYDAGTPSTLLRPSRSSAIAITTDDAVVLAVNPDNDSLSVINAQTKTKVAAVTFAAGSMPVSVALHPDNKTAFVALRKAQKLVKVVALDTITPRADSQYSVGSEPTGVALSPNGKYAVVANFGDTFVSLVDLGTGGVTSVDVGGNSRAVTVSNNGDGVDTDEKAYVTLFYGTPVGSPSEASDTGRKGQVVEIDLGTKAVTRTFDLNPIAVTGIKDPNTNDTGCSPNQLFAVVISKGRLYVPSVCASPKGPVFKFTNVFSVVSVIDLATGQEVTGGTGTAVLNKLVEDQKGTNATASLLGVPIDMDFRMDTGVGYVAAQAADTVQRVFYDATNSAKPITLGVTAGFQQIALTGRSPIGIVVAHQAQAAYVNNWITRSVSVINLSLQQEDVTIPSETSSCWRTSRSRASPCPPPGRRRRGS
jgi:DNA-binding beta-propeller fold protein YncE